MGIFFFFGKYNSDSVHDIAPDRTHTAVGIMEKHNGQIRAMYGLLGVYDLVMIVNLPGNAAALQASIELTREMGITFSTSPAVDIETFDNLLGGEADFPDLGDEGPVGT